MNGCGIEPATQASLHVERTRALIGPDCGDECQGAMRGIPGMRIQATEEDVGRISV